MVAAVRVGLVGRTRRPRWSSSESRSRWRSAGGRAVAGSSAYRDRTVGRPTAAETEAQSEPTRGDTRRLSACGGNRPGTASSTSPARSLRPRHGTGRYLHGHKNTALSSAILIPKLFWQPVIFKLFGCTVLILLVLRLSDSLYFLLLRATASAPSSLVHLAV